jgi:protein-S-isoprenylcysteine O-methyltransferase Ste14
MECLILFGILSIPVVAISWRTLFKAKSHGFYRFFAWECIIWLFASCYRFWFDNPFAIAQIFSWIFLIFSGYSVIAGVILLKKVGKPGVGRNEEALYQFEKTSDLVEQGIYKYIRHPLYSSLLFLNWGIFLKNPTVSLFVVAMISSICLYLTAIFDEKECIVFFGDRYKEYMIKTKRFIPFVF